MTPGSTLIIIVPFWQIPLERGRGQQSGPGSSRQSRAGPRTSVDFERCCHSRAQLTSGGRRGRGLHRYLPRVLTQAQAREEVMVRMPDRKGQGTHTRGSARVYWVTMHVGDMDGLPGVQEAGRLSGNWGAGFIYLLLTTSHTLALLARAPYASIFFF